ncbi:MAG TPA: hypothetical protein VLI45_09105 [Acidobacteriaceae bacterium]|nr:hypothetical protein [Acidobacteriaceae bacterium]
MHDQPYAFGKQCQWHGHPRDAAPSTRSDADGVSGLECPICGLPVIEVPSAANWWTAAEKIDAHVPEYAAMMRWSEGKCFENFDTLQNAYRQHMEGLR